MINKLELQSVINKYYLNGLIEAVKWDIKSNRNISWKNLFSEIISFNEYNFIHLNHNSFSF